MKESTQQQTNTNAAIQDTIKSYEAQLQSSPNDDDLLCKLGLLYLQAQNLAKAQECLQQAININPYNYKAMNDLSVILAMQSKFTAAKTILEKIIATEPRHADPYCNLGRIYSSEGDLTKAEQLFAQALKYEPNHSMATNNIATIFMKNNKQLEALSYIENALQEHPHNTLILANYGKLLKHFGNFSKAEQIFQQVLATATENVEIIAELADLNRSQNNSTAALELIAQAIKLDPGNYSANYYTMLIYTEKGQYNQALQAGLKALAHNNNSLALLGLLANLQLQLGLFKQFKSTQQAAIALIKSGKSYEPLNPFNGQILFPNNIKLQYVSAKKWGEYFKYKMQRPAYPRKTYQHDKLRIGYISGDFGFHPIGLLVEELFQLHNRNAFTIYGFPTKKHYWHRYNKICAQFDEVELLESKSPIQAAEIIHNHEIDILIDLTGPTAGDNYDILALQPASIQCHMLGYTGTLGVDFVQHFITTKTIVPETLAARFYEKLVYLPYSEMSRTGFQMPTTKPRRSEYGLPEEQFVFLAHHSQYRIDEAIFSAWMQILSQSPNSILWLHCKYQSTRKNLLAMAKTYNIPATRIIFYENSTITNDWQIQLADLFLDTFSHTSGTLSFFCAWCGLPMLTLLGKNPQARVAASYCKAANAPEQIVTTKDEYIKRAVFCAKNPTKLHKIKTKLLESRDTSYLFDQKTYVKHLETALQIMWQNFSQGHEDKNITVPK